MTRTSRTWLLALTVASFGGGRWARANPGDLDPSFGAGGKVRTAIGSAGEMANALVQQADGKLVAAGSSFNGANSDFALVRYNVDGSLDTSFGGSGKVTTDFGAREGILALLLQPDGKLVAAGQTEVAGRADYALARYNSDGSLDVSFGVSGKVTTNIGGPDDYAYAIVLQPDGKLVAAGESGDSVGSGPFDFTLARYNPDGSLDVSFGTGGTVQTSIGPLSDEGRAIVLQPDGKLVVAGSTSSGVDYDLALVRYNADGSIDTSFGTAGVTITDFGSNAFVDFADLVLQPDGKLVATGAFFTGVSQFVLARYNSDGSPDASFGSGGVASAPIGVAAGAKALIQQPDGKLVAGGFANMPSTDFAVARFRSDGSLDASFGSGGVVTTPFGVLDEAGRALVRQSDGKLVLAGYTMQSGTYDLALARYDGICGSNLRVGCSTGNERGLLLLKRDANNATRNKLVFKWLRGNVDLADLGDPTAQNDYTVCVYDNSGAVVGLSAAAGTGCVTDGCWSLVGAPAHRTGIRYVDRANPTAHDGIKRMLAKASSTGAGKLLVTAKGVGIPAIRMSGPLAYPVTVQVLNGDGKCWEQQFVVGDQKKNDGSTFRAAHRVP